VSLTTTKHTQNRGVTDLHVTQRSACDVIAADKRLQQEFCCGRSSGGIALKAQLQKVFASIRQGLWNLRQLAGRRHVIHDGVGLANVRPRRMARRHFQHGASKRPNVRRQPSSFLANHLWRHPMWSSQNRIVLAPLKQIRKHFAATKVRQLYISSGFNKNICPFFLFEGNDQKKKKKKGGGGGKSYDLMSRCATGGFRLCKYASPSKIWREYLRITLSSSGPPMVLSSP
jgi:hypothetical protein